MSRVPIGTLLQSTPLRLSRVGGAIQEAAMAASSVERCCAHRVASQDR